MKFVLLLLFFVSCFLFGGNFAQAGDVSCQVDLLKPRVNISQYTQATEITTTETKVQIQQNQLKNDNQHAQVQSSQEQGEGEGEGEGETQTNTNSDNTTEKTVKKASRLDGIFDILLPSKLRNPVEPT